jgi:transglutaminase-like putative cysteine protease
VILETVHRRLIVVMALSGLLAFAAGAGFEPVSALLAGTVLVAALFWRPSEEAIERIERIMIPIALLLSARALMHVLVIRGDVVIPVVDLLLLLLCAEVLRSSDASNDVRLYALTFALILASTAYRPGVLFALSFLLFIVLGSAALAIGLLRRKSARFGARDARLDRSFVVTSLALSAVTFATSVAVFVTFPRVSRSWSGRGDVMASSIVGFSDRISLGQHGSTIRSNPEIVLRVEFPEGRPEETATLRWRGRSYDRFDGVEWTRSAPDRPARAPVSWYRERWPDSIVPQRIFAAPLDVPVLFGLHPIQYVDPASPINPLMDDVGDWFFWGSDEQPTYTSYSNARPPSPDALREATGGYYPDRSRFLQLPDLPDRVRLLADSLTAPYDNRYDRVASIHRYLVSEFGYTRELPATARETSIEHFLFERREGHCEYFSSAMVVLLRAAGIHARNVNGFLGGGWNEFGGYLAVTQNEAHSWVEVWFPNYGWIEWDPTPPGSGDAAVARTWWFPGQQWFDGLSFRWNQWVLEYSIGTQLDLFDRIGDLFADGPGGDRGDGDRTGIRWWWLVAGAAISVVLGIRGFRPGGPRMRPESRVYRALARAARRAGVVEEERVSPGVLLRRIEEVRPEAFAPSARLVHLYHELRFGGRPRAPGDRASLREALAEAKRTLTL